MTHPFLAKRKFSLKVKRLGPWLKYLLQVKLCEIIKKQRDRNKVKRSKITLQDAGLSCISLFMTRNAMLANGNKIKTWNIK